MVIYSLILEGWYLLVLVRDRVTLNRGFAFAGAKIIGLLLGAIQVLPTYAVFLASVRAAPSLRFVSSGSLSPLNFLQLINPFVFTNLAYGDYGKPELGIYTSTGALLLALWMLLHSRILGERRRIAILLGALAGVSLLFALGRFSPLFPLYLQLPILNKFRCSARYIYFAHFALAGLAALGFDQLFHQTTKVTLSRRTKLLLCGFATAAALTLC